ncbi:MAG: DUF11 domain-containing protein [Rhodanobacter sp.]|nr:MAG: DUF11 domain-containing protein [Rhodanobacter sp.]
MRKIFKRIVSVPKKWLAIAAFGAMIAILPASNLLAANVVIEGAIGAANVTAGDTTYQSSINASYDQVVKFQVYYHNRELPDSGLVANNLRVKINIPSSAGTTQTVSTVINGDNTNTINDSATVHLDRSDAYLQYIPGSAVWRHNTGTNASPNLVNTPISDAVVTGSGGLVLENEQPCYNFAATVTVLARVMVPGVQITKQVRVKGTTTWSTTNTANPGDTVQYLISYKNTGNVPESNVTLRDVLPPHMQAVPGSAKIANSTYPSGVDVNTTSVVTGGVNAGTYQPGANAFLIFDAVLPQASDLACGTTAIHNVGIARPQGMSEYYNEAITNVTRTCVTPSAAFQCTQLDVALNGNRKITAHVEYSVSGGASLNNVRYDFGDATTPLLTDQTTVDHTYAQDGNYTIQATLSFNLPNSQTGTSACSKSITITTPTVTPAVTSKTPPTQLPNTGAGDIIGLFTGVSAAGTAAHMVVSRRRRQ